MFCWLVVERASEAMRFGVVFALECVSECCSNFHFCPLFGGRIVSGVVCVVVVVDTVVLWVRGGVFRWCT